MEDALLYQHRVADLLHRLDQQPSRKQPRLLGKEQSLLTDLRWWPTVLSLLASPSLPCPPPAIEGMWLPPMPPMPSRATITVADVASLATLVYEALSRLSPNRLGVGGTLNLLLAAPDSDAFAHHVKRLLPRLDDTFTQAFPTLAEKARWLGLEAFAQQVEGLRQSLVFTKVVHLTGEIIHTGADRAAAAHLVQAACTAPQWLKEGLDEMAGRADWDETVLLILRAFRKACSALEEGQDRAAVIGLLEAWPPLRRFLAYHRLLRKAPFPLRRGEDWLSRYGPRARQFLLQLGQSQDAQTAVLFQLALAESEDEAEQAIAMEPRLLSAEGKQYAQRLAEDAKTGGQVTFSLKLIRAAERIAAWLTELVRPERNPILRLAERVQAGELAPDEALAQVQQAETQRALSILHLAALDEQATWMYHSGDLRRAEIIATLNQAAAQQAGHPRMYVDACITLAQIKSELGQDHEAMLILRQAEPIAQQLGDPQRQALVVGILGNAYQQQADYAQALRCYERALQIAQQADLPSLVAAAMGNLANVYLLMGKPDVALDYAERALQRARGIQNPFQIAQALSTRALVLHQLSRYEEAIAGYQEALRALMEVGDKAGETRARLHLAQAYLDMGKPDQALEEMTRAGELAQRTAHLSLEVSILSSFGAFYYQRGDFHRALQYLQQALELAERLGLRDKTATVLVNLALVYLHLQQPEHMKSVLDRAFSLAREIRSPRIEAHAQLLLGDDLLEQRQWQESTSAFRQVEQLAREMGDTHLELLALSALGRVEERQGHWAEATEFLRRALEQASRSGAQFHKASILVHLGEAQIALRDYSGARETFDQAARMARETGLTYTQFYAHYYLGQLHESALDDLPGAWEHYRTAINALEQQRLWLGETEEFERTYIAGKQAVYRRAAQVLFALNQPLEALQVLEQGRARSLTRRFLQRDAIPPNVPEELRARYARTVQAVQFLRKIVYGEPGWGMKVMGEVRRAAAELRGESIDEQRERQEYQKALAEAEAELARITENIRTYAPNFGGALRDLPEIHFTEIARDPETAVVALFIGDRLGRAVLLHPSGSRVVDLPHWRRSDVDRLLYGLPEPLAELSAQARSRISQARTLEDIGFLPMDLYLQTLGWMIKHSNSFEMGWNVAVRTLISEKTRINALNDDQRLAMWQRACDVAARELQTRLWQPILPVLRACGATRVVLIPDADLHALPLALGLPEEDDAPSVMMAPTLQLYARCLQALREREPRENTLMLIANPKGDLDAADIEAELLRDLFSAHHQATFVLRGSQATQQNVIRFSRVGNYWHFAGHAGYTWQDPSLSALSLASGEILPLFWVPMWMDFRATRLVALSACETAMTPARDPAQEYTGLFTAFLTAGAPTVLASLWAVDSISTALLIHRFYQYHLGDPREGIAPRSPAEALRDAQQWLRELRYEELLQPPLVQRIRKLPVGNLVWQQVLAAEKYDRPFANPYFWAGFIIVGA